jgi:hypothetical protein
MKNLKKIIINVSSILFFIIKIIVTQYPVVTEVA